MILPLVLKNMISPLVLMLILAVLSPESNCSALVGVKRPEDVLGKAFGISTEEKILK